MFAVVVHDDEVVGEMYFLALKLYNLVNVVVIT